jgi:hypothetical protein
VCAETFTFWHTSRLHCTAACFSTNLSAETRGDFPHTFVGLETKDLASTAQNTGISLIERLAKRLIARPADRPNRSKYVKAAVDEGMKSTSLLQPLQRALLQCLMVDTRKP